MIMVMSSSLQYGVSLYIIWKSVTASQINYNSTACSAKKTSKLRPIWNLDHCTHIEITGNSYWLWKAHIFLILSLLSPWSLLWQYRCGTKTSAKVLWGPFNVRGGWWFTDATHKSIYFNFFIEIPYAIIGWMETTWHRTCGKSLYEQMMA